MPCLRPGITTNDMQVVEDYPPRPYGTWRTRSRPPRPERYEDHVRYSADLMYSKQGYVPVAQGRAAAFSLFCSQSITLESSQPFVSPLPKNRANRRDQEFGR